jgi:hypothetical protein
MVKVSEWTLLNPTPLKAPKALPGPGVDVTVRDSPAT